MIYCFDLDGTLCTINKDYSKVKPLKDRIEKVNKLYDEGHTILVDTARGSETGIDHTKLVQYQLSRWGVKYHKVRCGVKFFANQYIDDKGLSDLEFFK